jgi:iron complex transport system substrate-binding protein
VRIVSLIASATEIVDALGMTDALVGRSHECDYPERVKGLPVCTRPRIAVGASSAEIDRQVKESVRQPLSIYDVFDEVIESLEPTHILTQIQCEVCAVSLRDVEAAMARGMNGRPAIVSLQPNSLRDIRDDIRRVAAALGIPVKGERLLEALQHRMNGIASGAARRPAPRVACIEWIEPLMAAGNWTPELIEMAGGINLFGEAGKHSPWMSWKDLLAAEPDVIIVAPCGFDLARTQEELYWLTERPEFERLRSRIFLADGNQYFNRPGPRVVETLEILNEILQGAEPRHRGTAWRDMMSL